MSANKYYLGWKSTFKVYKQGWIPNIIALTHSYEQKQHIKALSYIPCGFVRKGKLVSYTVLDLQLVYIYVYNSQV